MPSATASKSPSVNNMSKPTYAVMVTESIKALGNRTASSVPAIKKQLGMQYKIEVEKINQKALTNAIKKGVQSGDFVQIKASYKLGKKATAVVKKTVVKKTTTTKTTITKKKPASGKVKSVIKKKAPTTTKVSLPNRLIIFIFIFPRLFPVCLTFFDRLLFTNPFGFGWCAVFRWQDKINEAQEVYFKEDWKEREEGTDNQDCEEEERSS